MGDGVYASMNDPRDLLSIDLRAQGEHQKYFLEPEVLQSLVNYANKTLRYNITGGPDAGGYPY